MTRPFFPDAQQVTIFLKKVEKKLGDYEFVTYICIVIKNFKHKKLRKL